MLLDIFGADRVFGERSRNALRESAGDGRIVACEVVWAEVSAFFRSSAEANEAILGLGVRFAPLDQGPAAAAGQAWGSYRRAGGVRRRVVADFLIGAHAQADADRLLTRDRGFFRSHFEGLELRDPSRL